MYILKKKGKSCEGWIYIVNCLNMKLLVIFGIKSYVNNYKVYCIYFFVEFWNMMLGNLFVILYSFYVGFG